MSVLAVGGLARLPGIVALSGVRVEFADADDLRAGEVLENLAHQRVLLDFGAHRHLAFAPLFAKRCLARLIADRDQIGRASCRERV